MLGGDSGDELRRGDSNPRVRDYLYISFEYRETYRVQILQFFPEVLNILLQVASIGVLLPLRTRLCSGGKKIR